MIENMYNIVHRLSGIGNNVLKGTFTISLKKQPTAYVMECDGNGSASYYQSAQKAICINEITGFDDPAPGTTFRPIKQKVANEILSLTGLGGNSYQLIDFNHKLFDNLPSIIKGLNTNLCQVIYIQDNNAHNMQELLFGTAKAMAEIQDQFFTINYHLDGWDQNGIVWAPNMMCHVYDESLSGYIDGQTSSAGLPNNPLDCKMWIKRVNFTKDVGGGAHTDVELTLPYTHSFDRIPTADQNTPANSNSSSYPSSYDNKVNYGN